MNKVLVNGGTVFVSKNVASYYVNKGYEVYVLNRDSKQQVDGVHLICADRNDLGDRLKGMDFDVIFDIASYNRQDVQNIVEALDDIKDYIFISSSAIYPHDAPQPFVESQGGGYNKVWGDYGMNKLQAEEYLLENVPQAYIIRPPYIYGKMENIYRAPFIFECALKNRKFYLPKDGSLQLQFFDVEDLCRFMDIILEEKPEEHIFNVGRNETISIKEWVSLCYEVAGETVEFVNVYDEENIRAYFCFNEYEYVLDVSRQNRYLKKQKSAKQALQESFDYYITHSEEVVRKEYIKYIDEVIAK